jgi:hypothetical protein
LPAAPARRLEVAALRGESGRCRREVTGPLTVSEMDGADLRVALSLAEAWIGSLAGYRREQ